MAVYLLEIHVEGALRLRTARWQCKSQRAQTMYIWASLEVGCPCSGERATQGSQNTVHLA